MEDFLEETKGHAAEGGSQSGGSLSGGPAGKKMRSFEK